MYSHSYRTLSEFSGVFRTLLNIWDEAFLRKLLTALSRFKYASRVAPLYSIGFIRTLA